MSSTRRVLLVNWDNYPNFPSGGVYVWAKRLVEGVSDWDFVVVNELTNSNVPANYTVPSNVKEVIEIPIFGTHRREEYQKEPFVRKILRTSDSLIEKKFIPLFDDFVSNLMASKSDHARTVKLIVELHNFLSLYDARKCLEHPLAWDVFLNHIKADTLYKSVSLREALTVFQVVQRSMQILSVDVPPVDVVHCSLVWLPSLTAIIAKAKYGCPIIVTEHGVAYRELMLYYNAYFFNEPSKIFWKVFARNIVRPVYEAADIIAPVCRANAVWERALGADPSKIDVVYNGIDTEKFRPMTVPRDPAPTVISVARIDPFKDITTLAYGIKRARESIPNIRCLLFGDSINLDYAKRCLNTVKSEGLEPNFTFMGATKEPEKAYNLGDVVVFSGITEGFPFAVIEAMACGKAIVATSVGGVPEALAGCGILVKSRDPDDLSKAIVRLLKDEKARAELGAAALKRARKEFSIRTSIDRYRDLYQQLAARHAGQPLARGEMVIAQ